MSALFPSSDIGMFGRRQRHARGHRIPVAIVSGPVGTTDNDTAVVTDNFDTDAVPLGIGCACCTVRGKLQTALRQLLAEREQRHFTRVAIKTNNDLGPILRTFATERALGSEFYVVDFPVASIGARTGSVCRFVLTEDPPVSWNAFSRFMTTLTALRGADLLHAKGLLNIEGCRGPVAVQFLGHLAHAPVELQAWPSDDRTSRLEFITRSVEEKMVRGLFDSVRALT